MSFLLDIQPSDLGFGPPFNEYMPIQNETIDFVAEAFGDGVPVVGICNPTGSGKSLNAVSIAKALGYRTAYITAFKGLQEQYARDFKTVGMVDIRGRNNYDCAHYSHLDCRGGSSLGCPYTKGKGCTYEVDKAIAKEAHFVDTNYQYWMNVNDKANGIERNEKEAEGIGENPFELLVLDEAHEASKLLADYVSCRLYEKDAKKWGGYPMNERLDEWNAWAKLVQPELKAEIRTTEMELVMLGKKATPAMISVLHHLQGLAQTIEKIAWAVGDDWVVDLELGTKYGRLWKFDCIWPGKYKQYLFCGVPRVLFMSATLKEWSLWDCGVKKEDYRFKSWRRIFPGNRHPIYKVHAKKPNGSNVSLKKDSAREDIERLVKFCDKEIIKPRLDRKGLIATMSYKYQQIVNETSEYTRYMLGNTNDAASDSAQEVAEDYRLAQPPSILVSPSFTTGWDFPMDQCEYIIVFKTPWIPAFSKIALARLKRDKNYANKQGMQMLEQICGRGMRRMNDRCEVFLVDGSIEGFLWLNKEFAQDWFIPAIRGVPSVPKPPMRLVDELGLGVVKTVRNK